MAEEDTGDRKEGESEQPQERDPSEQDPSEIDFPDDVELEFSGESVPEPPGEGEPTPEQLASEVAAEYETPPEEEPEEEIEPEEPEAEEEPEPTPEEPEEPAEEEPVEPEEAPETEEEIEEEEIPEEEPSPEDLAREVTEGLEEEEEELEEESEPEPETVEEETEEETDELDEIADEVLEETEEEAEIPGEESEGMVTFEGEPEDLTTAEETEEEEDEGTIQDMLEEEAEKAREGEDKDEEEELPEGYLTVEQLPEHEEFRVPDWIKKSGYVALIIGAVIALTWYLLMPLWEVFLTNQINNDMVTEDYQSAKSWARWGMFLDGATIRYDDQFLAYYLKSLLDQQRLELFVKEYQALTPAEPGPYVLQTMVEYHVIKGNWKKVREKSTRLQQFISTRGIGYLFHGRAMLELGDLQFARSDIERAENWLDAHPGILRVERDLFMQRGQYRSALDVANELRTLVRENTNNFELRVNDFVQLARIHRNLGKFRVSQRMLERALDLDPTNKEALSALSKQYVLEERWSAVDRLVEGSDLRRGYRKLYPFDPLGWWTASEVSISRDNYNRAIRLLERANNLNPRNVEVRRLFGQVYLNHLSEPRLAVKHLELSKKYGMDRLQFQNLIGQAYYRNGDYLKAVESYKILKDHMSDTLPGLYYNIATGYLAANKFDKAEKNLMKARELGYQNEDLFNQWGLMLELRGKTQQAYGKYFEGIQWGQRNNKPVDQIRANLNRLLDGREPEPISKWLTPLRTDFEIPYWRRVNQGG